MNLNRFKISVRVTLGVIIPLLMLMFVGIWSWIAIEGMFRSIQEVRDQRLQLMMLGNNMGKDLLQMQYYLTEVAIDKDERSDSDVFSGASDYFDDFLENLEEYKKFYAGKDNKDVIESVERIRESTKEFYELGKKMALAFVEERKEEGFEAKREFNTSAEYVDFDLEPLLRQERDLAVLAMNDLVAEMSQLKQGLKIVMLMAVLMTSLAGWLLIRSLVIPIRDMKMAMQTISEGDLDHQVPIIGRDELSDMANIFNLMANELSRTHSGLISEKEKLSTIILSAREGIVVTDRQNNVVLVNPSAERLLKKRRKTIIQEGFNQLVDDPAYIDAHLSENVPPDIIFYKDKVLSFYASSFYNEKDELVGSAALIRDVTAEKKLEEQLRHIATTDALTGLNNRRMFDESLVAEIGRSTRYKQVMSLILFDVDHFKKFNDTHGHDQGDRVLEAVGKQMKSTMRNLDISCRYGGEEFVAILPNTNERGAMFSAERLRSDIEAMVVDGLKVTISLGVVVYKDFETKMSGEKLVKLADNALYQAKRAGRNCVQLAKQENDPVC
ncbi:MAG: diguanylate cyclase [Magnetococcales bacterium]|nr:diguanylate cyclase [Magnetococcales bacterium]